MKRILLIAGLMLSFAGFSFAQDATSHTTAKKAKDKGTQVAPKTATTPATAATPAKPATTATAAKPATTGAAPTKKDGTPDMRYKANKEAKPAPATTHVKKDGTPDKRFKENKDPKKP